MENPRNDENLAVYMAAVNIREITRRRQMAELERRKEAIRRQWWRRWMPVLRRIGTAALRDAFLLTLGALAGILFAGWLWA